MLPKIKRRVIQQANSGCQTTPNSDAKSGTLSVVAAGFGAHIRSRKLIAALSTLLLASAATALPPGTEDEIRSRLVAAGQLCRAGDDCGVAAAVEASAPRSGEEVYNQFCFACHATGVGGAPTVGDAAAWEPRIAKGMEALWGTMQNGLNTMPPKGTCMNCSEDELRASMNYLVESAK